MKKLVIGLTISASVFGGFVIAQSMTSGSAATQTTESIKLITVKEAKEIALKTVNGTITEVDFDRDYQRPHYEFEIQSNNEEVNIDVDATTGKATITERETTDKVKATNTNPVQTNETASKVQYEDDRDDDVKATSSQPAAKQSATKQNEVSNTTANQTNQTNATATQKEVITKAEAIKIASTVAKGTVTKVELDRDDDDQTKSYELEFKDGNVEYDVEVDAYTGKIIEVNQDLED